jgi:hypothetical protein
VKPPDDAHCTNYPGQTSAFAFGSFAPIAAGPGLSGGSRKRTQFRRSAFDNHGWTPDLRVSGAGEGKAQGARSLSCLHVEPLR